MGLRCGATDQTMQEHDSGTTRRNVLKATAGLLGVGATAGCIDGDDMSAAMQDLSVREHPELPNYKRNWDPELEMGLSGAVLYTREGAEAHTVEVARLDHAGDWFLDEIDLVQYEDDGEPESDVRAEDLAEGGTVVFLRAHNDRGTICSPDYERYDELNALLDA